MPIHIEEPIKATLVIANVAYLGQSVADLLVGFDMKTSGNILASTPNESGQHFRATKDRITIYQQPNRVMIEKESPCGIDDFDKLADVAEMAISNINVHVSDLVPGMGVDQTPPENRTYTYGFNLEMGCRFKTQEGSIDGVPITRFLNVERLMSLGCAVTAGNLELEFSIGDYLWRLGVKPFPGFHDGSLLLVAVNRHSENQPLPRTGVAIKEAFEAVWNVTENLINMLEIQR